MQVFKKNCAAYIPVSKVRYRDEIPAFLILAMHVQNKKSGILSL